ncbi:biliverdin-producing heme oxygenase [Nonomuraea sp. NBC_01738]|uniref:biliverdin-producing heme oxygenase n=1 Tax=Nonomuraea sp. NBC_01738 TaxID=2976003 RepID=UPI002E117246|nr:biliverdin-producing heme oxygenase [Nonomuraea sp. NBC_01738]
METAEPLSTLLYQGTTTAHRAAENTPYMLALFQGKISAEGYRLWLSRFHPVYAALEEAAEALRHDPAVGRLYLPELFRTEAIERDLAFFHGRDWRAALGDASPATGAYVARLRHVRDEWPLGLVSHQWIRYAGYLHGGATLAGMLSSAYGLSGGEGMAFYDFAEIGDTRAFVRKYHAKMDAVPVGDGDLALLVAEANFAFDANAAITVELGEACAL